MSTQALVPMFSPDGSLGDIPPERVQDAISKGFKRGINVVSNDGQKGTIPLDRLPDALKRGMTPATSMPTTQFEKDTNPANQPGFFHSLVSEVGHLAQGALNISPMNPLQGIQMSAQTGVNDMDRALVQKRSAPYRAVAALGDQLGINASGMEQQAEVGNTKGVLGTATADALPAATPYLARALKARTGPPINDAVAAARITDAVNPPPKQMTKFQQNVEAQMPNIRQFIQEKPQNAGGLLDVVTKAADAKKAAYYRNIIQPHADVNVAAPSLYKGELVQGGTYSTRIPAEPSYPSRFAGGIDPNNPTVSANVNVPRSATIGMLDKRLSEINNTLAGAYDKEGVAQQVALSASDKLALKAEAAQIRDVMNEQLGTRTGLGKDAVAKARQDFGQLGDIQKKLQLAVNKQRYYENLKLQKPITPEDVTTAGLARQAAIKAGRKIIGTPQERMIKGSF